MLGLLRAARWCFHTVPVPAVTHGGGCVASPLHFQSRGACAGPAGTVGPGVVRVPVPCWLISPVSPRCLPRPSQTSPQKTHPTPQHPCAVSQVCSSVPVPTGQSDVAEQQCVRTRTRLHTHAAGLHAHARAHARAAGFIPAGSRATAVAVPRAVSGLSGRVGTGGTGRSQPCPPHRGVHGLCRPAVQPRRDPVANLRRPGGVRGGREAPRAAGGGAGQGLRLPGTVHGAPCAVAARFCCDQPCFPSVLGAAVTGRDRTGWVLPSGALRCRPCRSQCLAPESLVLSEVAEALEQLRRCSVRSQPPVRNDVFLWIKK